MHQASDQWSEAFGSLTGLATVCVIVGKLLSLLVIQLPYLENERIGLPLSTRKIFTDSQRVTASKKLKKQNSAYQLQIASVFLWKQS